MTDKIKALLQLSHDIGREDRLLAILGEGNTSVKLGAEQFAVKASGACLATLTESEVTVCDTVRALAILDKRTLADDELDQALLDVRVGGAGKKPSIEALFHWMEEDMDLNAGTILDGTETVEQVGQRIFEKIIAVSSGEPTKSELAGIGDEEFAPWFIGPQF